MTIEHHWAKITLDGKPLWVSRDAYKVNGVRKRFTPKDARETAAALGGRLPTPREIDARWAATGFHNLPHPQDWKNPNDDEKHAMHEAAIAKDLADYFAKYGEPFRWIVGNVGKPWVHYRKDEPRITLFVVMKSGTRALYGMHYDVHTKALARGIPLHPAETLRDAWVIQRPWDSSHNDHHIDYVAMLVCARDDEPEEYWEISADGFVRHVLREGSISLNDRDAEPEPVTQPRASTPPRIRALEWSLAQVGHRESPRGSNTSPLIRRWAKRATRDGVGSLGSLWTATTGTEWCTVFGTCGAMGETGLPGDPEQPCGYRVSGAEAIADAEARGTLVEPAELFAGLYELRPGDLIITNRIDPATGTVTWKTHTRRFVQWEDRSKWLAITVEGNAGSDGQQVVIVDGYNLRSAATTLRGVIRYFDPGETNPLRNNGSSQQVQTTHPEPVTLANDGYIAGIDLSHHQSPATLPWEAIGQRFRFAYVRANYGIDPDGAFLEHVRRARSVGLTVGAYIYVRQGNEENPQLAEAQLATLVAQMEAAGFDAGDLVPAVDIESSNGSKVRGDDGPLDPAKMLPRAKHITDAIVARFGSAVTYTERDIWKRLGSPAWMVAQPVWTSWPFAGPPWPTDWSIWQHKHGDNAKPFPNNLDQNFARKLTVIA